MTMWLLSSLPTTVPGYIPLHLTLPDCVAPPSAHAIYLIFGMCGIIYFAKISM